MISKMDEKTSNSMRDWMGKAVGERIKQENEIVDEDRNDIENLFADNVNELFPINTRNQIFVSAALLIDPNVSKVYDSVGQLYMFQRLITAANTIFDKEEDHTRLRDMLKGGSYQVGNKIYTEEEMIVEATRLAEQRAKELFDANAKNGQIEVEIKEAKELAATKEAEAQEVSKKLAEAETKLAEIEKEREVEAAQRLAEKAEVDAKALADKRVKELVDVGVEVKSSDILFAYVKALSDETYSDFKIIVEEVLEAAKKKIDDKEKNEKRTKAGIVDNSLPLPKSIGSVEADELDVAFATALGKNKSGGDK